MVSVSFSRWRDYTWKNELAEQKRRIDLHLSEALNEADTDYNPYHMLERAVGVAAVCMRRLIECRLVTDAFCRTPLLVHQIRSNADRERREPFDCFTGGNFFHNYDLTTRWSGTELPKLISDRFLHARVIAVIYEDSNMPAGILIASDKQHRSNVYHFTAVEIASFFDAFLNDEVTIMSDGYLEVDSITGQTRKVHSIRE